MWLDSIKRYMTYVKPYKWLLALTIIIGILKFAIPLLLPWIVQIILDDILLYQLWNKDATKKGTEWKKVWNNPLPPLAL